MRKTTEGRPAEVGRAHLERKAIIYVRQSSDRQVQENQGSTADQRAQAECAAAWGWPKSRIELIDDDLGYSGTTSVNRRGYQRMVDEISAGLVGAVFLSDLSRAGRSAAELMTFLELCHIHGVLLVVGGQVQNLQDSGHLFMNQIVSVVAQFENARRKEAMERGKLAKVRAGCAMSRPPAGYVRRPDGGWEEDPDPGVRQSIRTVFTVFLEKRSTPETVRTLRQRGVRLPRRERNGDLRWVEAKHHFIAAMLSNPRYTGDYHYRLQRVDPSKGRSPSGELRRRKAFADETVIIEGHHEPYVSKEEWDQIQHILKVNAPSQEHRNLGPGAALVQGILRCAQHLARVMNPAYHSPSRDGRYAHSYVCPGDYVDGGEFCKIVSGRIVDRAVAHAVLARVSPPRLEVVREKWERDQAGHAGERRRRQADLQEARRRADRLRELILTTDPTLANVIDDYARELELTLARVSALESELNSADLSRPVFTDKMWDELRQVDTIFHAPNTTDRDRKEIIRTLVKGVIVEERTDEEIRLRIVWQDGTPDEMVEVKLVPWMHRKIMEMAADGKQAGDIVQWLNDHGHVNLQGRPWTEPTVRTLIQRKRKERGAKDACAA